MNAGFSVRRASSDDLPELEHLLRRHGLGSASRYLKRGAGRHVLVMERDSWPIGVAVVQIDGSHGHLLVFALEHEEACRGLEDRLLGIVEAMCQAFRADLDVPGAQVA